MGSQNLTTMIWWASQRRRYNRGLILAGLLAFVCYATVVFVFDERIPDPEITVFTILLQAVGYLIMMGIANVCYYLGPISESIIHPSNPTRFRAVAFALGYWGSASLPFIIPVLLLMLAATQPNRGLE